MCSYLYVFSFVRCGSESGFNFLFKLRAISSTIQRVDSRSVMLLDVLGCTRTTMIRKTRYSQLGPVQRWCGNRKIGSRWEQLLLILFGSNVEYLVKVAHQTALIMSLPFVHTARRCYRWLARRGRLRLWMCSLRASMWFKIAQYHRVRESEMGAVSTRDPVKL